MLDQHELAWLLAACEELPDFGEEDRPFDYLEALFITVLDFHSRGEMVEKALDHYTATARTKLKLTGHQSLLKWLARYGDNQAELEKASLALWGNRHWTRLRLLKQLVAYFDEQGVVDATTLRHWAMKADFERDFKGRVKGLGYTVFHWLQLRCGVPTIKPDVWVLNFVQRVIGRRPTEREAVQAFVALAPYLKVPLARLDKIIWTTEREWIDEGDCPGMRIVFWRLMQQLMVSRLDACAPGWRAWATLTVDAPERLRYGIGGLEWRVRREIGGWMPGEGVKLWQDEPAEGFPLIVEINAGAEAAPFCLMDEHYAPVELFGLTPERMDDYLHEVITIVGGWLLLAASTVQGKDS